MMLPELAAVLRVNEARRDAPEATAQVDERSGQAAGLATHLNSRRISAATSLTFPERTTIALKGDGYD